MIRRAIKVWCRLSSSLGNRGSQTFMPAEPQYSHRDKVRWGLEQLLPTESWCGLREGGSHTWECTKLMMIFVET